MSPEPNSALGLATPVLDPHDCSDLVRLRAALLSAHRLAGDSSEVGRHTALVALDGVCEYAMWLASQHLGQALKPMAGFHDHLSKLATLSHWAQPGRRGVVQMHSARNQAQHGGALPDPTLLAGWREAADSFVRSLVRRAYGVALDEVLLAAAVEDPELRALVEASEREMNGGQSGKAFHTAVRVFALARSKWHEQQEHAYGMMSSALAFDNERRWPEAGARATDYADVSVFASDLSEYHWLLATRRQIATTGISVTAEDARRALLFGYHWVLRWEHFDRGYPSERWQRQSDELEPPSAGDSSTPTIVNIEPREEWFNGNDTFQQVLVQIANVPDRGRGDWGLDMGAAIMIAAERLSVDPAHVVAGDRRLTTGEFLFSFARDVGGAKASELLLETVRQATVLASQRAQTRDALEVRTQAVVSAVSPVFAGDAAQDFGAVTVVEEVRDHGQVLVVQVQFLGTAQELSDCAGTFRDQGGSLATASYSQGSLTFEAAPDIDAQLGELSRAVEGCLDNMRRRRKVASDQQSRAEAFAQGLAEGLGTSSAPLNLGES